MTKHLVPKGATTKEKIWVHIQKECETDCWLWLQSLDRDGYGILSIRDTNTGKYRPSRAHRESYKVFIGPIPEGMQVAHRCDNRRCVNPEHLFLATHAENIADMCEKRRTAYSCNHRTAKLNPKKVIDIRNSKLPYKELALLYSVSKPTIKDVRRKRTWKYVE
jgi:hypothetical protein